MFIITVLLLLLILGMQQAMKCILSCMKLKVQKQSEPNLEEKWMVGARHLDF
jgi:hypothetical protein